MQIIMSHITVNPWIDKLAMAVIIASYEQSFYIYSSISFWQIAIEGHDLQKVGRNVWMLVTFVLSKSLLWLLSRLLWSEMNRYLKKKKEIPRWMWYVGLIKVWLWLCHLVPIPIVIGREAGYTLYGSPVRHSDTQRQAIHTHTRLIN